MLSILQQTDMEQPILVDVERHDERLPLNVPPFSIFNVPFSTFNANVSVSSMVCKGSPTLSADGNMYSRRGYGSSELNTDDFVLNASISQPFLKGKLIARIEAFDLLHQLSNTHYSVNAQGRTETWYRSLPHYVMAHLVYHWNKNPKKK